MAIGTLRRREWGVIVLKKNRSKGLYFFLVYNKILYPGRKLRSVDIICDI